MARRIAASLLAASALVATVAYLRDPPWLGRVTSGLGPWTEDATGARFRWTTGRASLYVPSDAPLVTMPLRLGRARADGGPVRVTVAVDGRAFSTLVLDDATRWEAVAFSPPRRAARRFLRVDIHVDRVIRHGLLGVQVGELAIRSRGPRAGVRQ